MKGEEVKETPSGFITGMTGKYYWQLICNIDNSDGGKYTYSAEKEISTLVNKSEIIERVRSSKVVRDLNLKMERGGGAKIKLVDVKATNTMEL